MGRLILVANRLPVTVTRGPEMTHVSPSPGGLAAALRGLRYPGGTVWIGWPGPVQGVPASEWLHVETRLRELGTVPVMLTAREVTRFYEGFANGILWPLFHYVTGVLPLRVEGWEEYQAVNARFAEAVVSQYRAGDVIWVHDYHLLLLPSMLRARLPDARIGFFLHIPFPTSELIATLPHREELMRGMMGADVVGFHTMQYARHFRSATERVLGEIWHGDTLERAGHRLRVGVFPISIDVEPFEAAATDPQVEQETALLRGDGAERLLVGIDRLDYTKGIPRRLLAFESLLRRHAEWRGRVRLIQVAVPSRTGVTAYSKFRHEIDALVGRINGDFATPHWTPVRYLHQSVPMYQLLALYRAADVMLVTPVRDGMNLVAKEFVATRSDDDGVLVLSEFAGAAAELTAAVLVNPYDVDGTGERLHGALTMPREERRTRMKSLRAVVREYDVHRWTHDFVDTLLSPALEARET
jgi:trehalose 6-phosphate synthase/phosphatase